MYKKIRGILSRTLIPAVLAVAMLPMTAFAAGDTCTASIPVTVGTEAQAGSQAVPGGLEYKLVLEAVTPGAPMPASAEITVGEDGKGAFGPITYTELRDYQYKVYQKFEQAQYFTFDERVYYVTVQILNDENGGLKSNIVAYDDPESTGETGKAATVAFANTYYRQSGGGNGGGGGGGGGGGPRSGGSAVIADPLVPLASIDPFVPIDEVPVPLALLPKTGDTTNLALWMALAAISGCGLVVMMAWKRRMG